MSRTRLLGWALGWAVVALGGGWPLGAAAQYYPGIGAQIMHGEVPAGKSSLIPQDDPLFKQARAASGLELEGLIRLEPGLSRQYSRFVEEEDAPWAVTEELIASELGPRQTTSIEPVDYRIDGQPLLLGMGLEPADDNGWQVYVVATFLEDADGQLQELARWPAGATYSEGIYLLDLNSDGVLEVVMPWATGVAGGGGIEVVALVPTGGIAGFGDSDYGSTLYSAVGSCSLLDFDQDGNWEIETVYPVLANWAFYYYSDLMVFDSAKWDWVSGAERFPEYYAAENSFYRQLNINVQRFAQDPAAFRTDQIETDYGFACLIDGEWCTLDAFCADSAGTVDQQLVEWLAEAVAAMEPSAAEG